MMRWGLLLLGLSQVGKVDSFLFAMCMTLIQTFPLPRQIQKGLLFIFLIVVLFDPNLVFYLGLWAYDAYPMYPLFCLYPVFPAYIYGQPTYLWAMVWTVFGWYVRQLEEKYKQDHVKVNHQRDDFVEKERFLAEQNARLSAEKQYEVEIARLQERNRIARDLHDSIGHVLSSSLLQVGALQVMNQNEDLVPLLATLQNTLDRGMHSARQSLHDLEDSAWNFDEQLRQLIHEFQFCPLILKQQMNHPLPIWQAKHLIAIISEALHNVTCHSNATQVNLTIREQPGFYQLIIEDNGQVKQVKEGGMGLLNMQSRVKRLNGHWNLNTQNGFKIHISWPKEEMK